MSEPERSGGSTLYEILEAFRSPAGNDEPSCALCRRIMQSVERGIRLFFAEFVNDPQVREGWRRARGFCPEHTALVAKLGDSLGVAILYADLARLARERLEAGMPHARRSILPARSHRSPRPLPAPCPACALACEAEARCVAAIVAGLAADNADLWSAIEASNSLCLAHTDQMIAAAPTIASRLRQQQAAHLAALQAELEEIIRKNDYRFRGEPWGPEKDAWLRALQLLRRPRTS